jgi:hypothetical protein
MENKNPTVGAEDVFYNIISSWTPTFKVLCGRTMLLITTTSSSTATDSPVLHLLTTNKFTLQERWLIYLFHHSVYGYRPRYIK